MASDGFKVAIIGAGMAGLFLAEQLQSQGIAFTIFEKAPEVGGTWYANTYPGLHVDVLTRSYEFPTARSLNWSKRYAPGTEIQAYLIKLSRDKRIVDNIRFNCEVTDATYDDGIWTVTTADGDQITANVVVAATGFLRVPAIPRIAGKEDFQGPSFHSSAWDHSVDLKGKRIGVIGTGSSGVQIVTELGLRGHDVTHFIRTPQWMMIRKNPKVKWIERLALGIPGTGKLFDWHMRRLRAKIEGPEAWRFEAGPQRDLARKQFAEELSRAIRDPELLKKLTPTEPAGCKRIAKTESYYEVLQKPNVHPVVGPIQRLVSTGVFSGEGAGELHEIDVLVYATGFDSHAYMRPMKVKGADGKTIDELWKDSVYSYYGIGIPHMPNFFLLNGPFAPINLIAIPALLHDEVGLLSQLLAVIRTDNVALAPSEAATRRFCDDVRATLPSTTFSECMNWFTDKSGLAIIWPWVKAEHGKRLALARFEDFDRYPISTNTNLPASDAAHSTKAGHVLNSV